MDTISLAKELNVSVLAMLIAKECDFYLDETYDVRFTKASEHGIAAEFAPMIDAILKRDKQSI